MMNTSPFPIPSGDEMSIHVQETGLWSRTTVVPDQRSLRLAWSEARPAVQGIFQLRLLSGILIGAGGLTAVDWTIAVATALSWLLVTWSIYLINGVADQAEDVSNGSQIGRASCRERVWTSLVLRSLVEKDSTVNSTALGYPSK